LATMDTVEAGLLRRVAERIGRKIPYPPIGYRAAAFIGVTFVVPALLTLADDRLFGKGWTFSRDVAAAVRFLWVGPLLIAIDHFVGQDIRKAVLRWRTDGLVPEAGRPAFERTVERLQRLSRSWLPVLVVMVGAFALSWLEARGKLQQASLVGGAGNWMFPAGRRGLLSPAGWWYALVSVPLIYTHLLRWLWRFGLWVVLLWRMAFLPPRVLGLHPDRVGGLARIVSVHSMFVGLLLALSSMASAALANRMIHVGMTLEGARTPATIFLVVLLVVFLGPLLFFTPLLFKARKRASVLYGEVACRHTDDFELLARRAIATDPTLGDRIPDAILENQANLSTSYAELRSMRISLVELKNLKTFGLAAAGPLLLTGLAKVPLSDLLSKLKVLLI
jgi:hypothetical protein